MPSEASDDAAISPHAEPGLPSPPSDPTPDIRPSPTPPASRTGAPPPPAKPRRPLDRSIVEGPLGPAVWKIAWPTVVTNILGGLQGIIDHAMVGHYVGFTANAGIGVATQLWIVVIVFIMSVFTGMSVMVARFIGAGDTEQADRVVYQAFLTATAMSLGVLAPIGWVAAPYLMEFVNAAPAVQAQALPYFRLMMAGSTGMLVFYMLGGALRSAGDARTPMVLGIVMTVLNVLFNIVFIGGLGPVPAMGTVGAALGTIIATTIVAAYAVWKLWRGGWAVHFPRDRGFAPDWAIIRSLFRFGLPAGFQGIAMNIGGVLLLKFIGSLAQSAAAQAAYTVSYSELFALVTWTGSALMGATAAVVGQNLGARQPERAEAAVRTAAGYGIAVAVTLGLAYFFIPGTLLALFGLNEPEVVAVGTQLLRVLAISGLFITVALTFTGGLQGTGDTKSPFYISIVSQIVVPLSICFVLQQLGRLEPLGIWL
ncbi:MAG: MATE family efflux transporter, partial [Gemmatimonadaceae bacterium]|nr:MATE family efflux transporter [Gemmatimonadaceae bacterium]